MTRPQALSFSHDSGMKLVPSPKSSGADPPARNVAVDAATPGDDRAGCRADGRRSRTPHPKARSPGGFVRPSSDGRDSGLLDKGFRFVERSHLAVHGLLHGISHEELLEPAELGAEQEGCQRPVSLRGE